jgi:hypothetical protein
MCRLSHSLEPLDQVSAEFDRTFEAALEANPP